MNFIEFLRDRGIRLWNAGEHHHVTSQYVGFDCPFCSPNSGRVRAGYHLTKNFVSCWTCGGHSVGATLAELTGLPAKECLRILDPFISGPTITETTRGRLHIPKGVVPLLPPHIKYLKGRGFDPEALSQTWKIGAIGNHVRYPWRIFIPIELRGETVSWTTRTISQDPLVVRYRSAQAEEEKISAKAILYGQDLIPGHSVIVHEGPTDVWRTGPGSVATLGMNVSVAQIRKIASFPNRVVCFDSEPKAQQRATQLCRELALFPGKTANVTLDAKDAGSAPISETRRLRRLLV